MTREQRSAEMATVELKTRLRLSAHFVVEEFDCPDGEQVPAAALAALIELCEHMLEPLRACHGPCEVLSGHRSIAHNAAIGGARHSQHLYGQHPRSVAADVRFGDGEVRAWARDVRRRFDAGPRWTAGGRGGVGNHVREGYVHVDSGPRRDWRG